MTKSASTTTPASASNPAISDPITLDTPVVRGDTSITSVQVRKPLSGELRGVTLSGLMQLDVREMIVVLPRITIPTLMQNEVEKLDPADLVALGAEVVGFLMSKADKASLPA
jgi:hypothetical protein